MSPRWLPGSQRTLPYVALLSEPRTSFHVTAFLVHRADKRQLLEDGEERETAGLSTHVRVTPPHMEASAESQSRIGQGLPPHTRHRRTWGGGESTLGSGCKEKAMEVLTKLSGDVKMHHTQEWSHTELYVELT